MVPKNEDVGPCEVEPIFRVISFYELIGIIEKNKLRFARMDTMDDPNEAITSVLDSEIGAAFMGSEFDPHETHKRHKMNQRAVYISCWTREPDNIAIWSIYSPDKDRVMVRTSAGKLKAAMNTLDERFLGLGNEVFVKNKDVSNVKYVNLQDLKNQWSLRAEAMRVAKKADKKAGRDDDEWSAESIQLRKLRGTDLQTPYLKKDERYEYEREVRAVFTLKARAEVFKIEATPFASNGERALCAQDSIPEQIEIPVSSDFIEEIVLDGRMSLWQRQAVEYVLQKYDRTAKVSGAFSSLYG